MMVKHAGSGARQLAVLAVLLADDLWQFPSFRKEFLDFLWLCWFLVLMGRLSSCGALLSCPLAGGILVSTGMKS